VVSDDRIFVPPCIYWEQWEKLLEATANIQKLLPGSIMIGGSAAAIHLQHRYSFDADHILSNLKKNYAEVGGEHEKIFSINRRRLSGP
jgi:hypothetical protein